jgi:hypothetical protein
MKKFNKEKMYGIYREVFPTLENLINYLKGDFCDGELLTIAADYNCFIDFYEKWGNDIDDDDLSEFDMNMLLFMKDDLIQSNYHVTVNADKIPSLDAYK